MIGRKLMFAFSVLCAGAYLATTRPLLSQAQDPYLSLVAQARSDLNSGNTAKALEEAQQAEKLNLKPWEAFLIAGAAHESQKQYVDATIDFADALPNAPEDKMAAIQVLFERCKKEASEASATQANAPTPQTPIAPAQSSDNSPLADTIRFIQEKLNGLGRITYIEFWRDTSVGSTGADAFSVVISNVRTEANPCTIYYHGSFTQNGRGGEMDSSFSLKDVRDVIVEPKEQYENAKWVELKLHLVTNSTNPPVIALIVRHNQDISTAIPFLFTDPSLADSVAKALVHAVELCGGGASQSQGANAQATAAAVAPSGPKASGGDNGPSLAITMQFIQNKMNGQGEVGSVQVWGATADAGSCTIKASFGDSDNLPTLPRYYRSNVTVASLVYPPDPAFYRTVSVTLKDVKAITVRATQYAPPTFNPAWSGGPDEPGTRGTTETFFGVSLTAEEPIFQVRWVLTPAFASALQKEHLRGPSDDNLLGWTFLFRDEDMANRVAKAMTHAAELCGAGSKPEPF